MGSRFPGLLFYLLLLAALLIGILMPGVPLTVPGMLLVAALLVFVVAHRDALWGMLQPQGSSVQAKKRGT